MRKIRNLILQLVCRAREFWPSLPGGRLRFPLDAKLMILLLVEEWLARAEGPGQEGPGVPPGGPPS